MGVVGGWGAATREWPEYGLDCHICATFARKRQRGGARQGQNSDGGAEHAHQDSYSRLIDVCITQL